MGVGTKCDIYIYFYQNSSQLGGFCVMQIRKSIEDNFLLGPNSEKKYFIFYIDLGLLSNRSIRVPI